MSPSEVQDLLEKFIRECDFNAPYGILTGEGKSSKGKSFKSITFGRAATLDASIEIYGERFMLLKTSRGRHYDTGLYSNIEQLKEAIKTL